MDAQQRSASRAGTSAGVPGVPPDFEIFAVENFKGINTKASRPAIDDQEFSWLENWFPIGDGNMRTLYDQGTSIYTASGDTILFHYMYNIGSTQYAIVFLTSGKADQVNVNTMAVTHISAVANTFYNGGNFPDVTQFGSSGLVIISYNGYYAWDGTLYSPGGFAPSWLSGVSTLSPTGNTHTTTTIDSMSSTAGIVVGMGITSSTGDIPAGTTVASIVSSTSITISNAATGTHSSQTFTIQWFMPSGLVGNAIEIYQNRVWFTNGATLFFSAPANGATFSLLGGGSVTSTDAFLKQGYTGLKQSNGFLYLIADCSINVISNVQTSGSPAITTFNNLNADPQVGTPWHGSIQEFGRGITMGNTSGIYALFGGAAEKTSDSLDGFISNTNPPITGNTNFPSSGVATIFGIKVLGVLFPSGKDYLGNVRSILAIWDGKKWFMASQNSALIYINTQEVESNLTMWGTDGTNLFPLFSTADTSISKIAQTKLWAGQSYLINKQALRGYVQIVDNAGAGTSDRKSVV